MENKTHWKKLMDKAYIGDWKFEGNNGDLILTINKVVQEEVLEVNSNTKSKEAIIYFKEISEKLVCNTTNAKRIEKICGSGLVEDWIGHKIALYWDKTVKFGREIVGGVRVRTTAPTETNVPKCMICGNDIQPANGMSAKQVGEYTKTKYGKCLCAECAMKLAQTQTQQ